MVRVEGMDSNCSLPRVVSYVFKTSDISDLKTKANRMIILQEIEAFNDIFKHFTRRKYGRCLSKKSQYETHIKSPVSLFLTHHD